MKICITTTGPDLNSAIDPRFARCQYFLIVDQKGKLIEAIKNEGVGVMRGAGVAAAQTIVNSKAEIIITGNVGPNAYYALSASGIKVFAVVLGITAKEALNMYKKGQLKEITIPLAPGRFGSPSGLGRGGGLGAGRGRGRR